MNIENYLEYCLSLSTDIEEILPFQKFKSGEGVLVFYVMGHMFSSSTAMISPSSHSNASRSGLRT